MLLVHLEPSANPGHPRPLLSLLQHPSRPSLRPRHPSLPDPTPSEQTICHEPGTKMSVLLTKNTGFACLPYNLWTCAGQ